MATRLPLVIVSGQVEQLQAGDAISGAVVTITQIEFDFGAVPVSAKSFIIVDAAVTAASKIIISQHGGAATGRQADENEMDQLALWGNPGVGQFTLYATGTNNQLLSGKYRANYMVG